MLEARARASRRLTLAGHRLALRWWRWSGNPKSRRYRARSDSPGNRNSIRSWRASPSGAKLKPRRTPSGCSRKLMRNGPATSPKRRARNRERGFAEPACGRTSPGRRCDSVGKMVSALPGPPHARRAARRSTGGCGAHGATRPTAKRARARIADGLATPMTWSSKCARGGKPTARCRGRTDARCLTSCGPSWRN